uniref:Calponin-homology (CH) domain-containing protein n=1 Tax=Steinernema glaseri TaxID=37863 RepID=A0A1I7ZM63_9BILA
MDDENISISPSVPFVKQRRRSQSCGLLTPSKLNIHQSQTPFYTETPNYQLQRRAQLEARMNARREAAKARVVESKLRQKFDAAETAQVFLNSTGNTNCRPVANMYDTEEQQSKQLSALAKWINHLVGTDYYDTSEVDALLTKTKSEAEKYLRELLGNFSKESVKKEMNSNERLSSQMRVKEKTMTALQTKGTALFLSSPFPSEINRLVQGGQISVRADKKVFSDIGLQMDILQLFLSFHPIWLQAGLQLITGQKLVVNNTQRRHISVLTEFIQKYIMSDPSILSSKKYVIGKSKKIVTPEGVMVLHRHFIAKTCHFLIAVELMRSSKLVPHMKCLFLRNSQYKCFNDIYAMLSKEILAGSTNLPKLLKKIGFNPEFKQGFFEEYDYSVGNNFSSMLGDGFTLGKVIEIVGGYEIDQVIKMLRNPGGDRLRKLGNLRTVLQMARHKGIDIGDVKPENILLGNVNTVLELIWRIIGFYAVSTPKHSIQYVEKSAVIIQAHFRGFLTRQAYAKEIGERKDRMKQRTKAIHNACCDVPLHDATFTVTNREQNWGATVIQAYSRGFLTRRKYALVRQTYRGTVMERQYKAAIVIQATVRGFLARIKFVREMKKRTAELREQIGIQRNKAAIVIQAALRRFFARQRYVKMVEEKRSQMSSILEDQNRAALIIQAAVRMFLIQRRFRRMILKKPQDRQYTEKQEKAAITIQAAVKGFLTRYHYAKEIAERKIFITEWKDKLVENPEINVPIYERMRSCLEALLDESFKVRMLAAFNIAKFAWLSSRCAEYIAENNGIPVVIDSMNNVNRGICTEDALEQLGSILLVLVQSRSHIVRFEVRKHAEATIKCVFHHMYAHLKSEKVLNTLGRIVLAMLKLRVPVEYFDKVRFQRKKIWEKCSKLPGKDSRWSIISVVVESVDSYS